MAAYTCIQYLWTGVR